MKIVRMAIWLVVVLFGTDYARADSWTTVNVPGASSAWLNGISGSTIFGDYDSHGFLYNGTSLTTLDKEGAVRTSIYGIDQSNIVGIYFASNRYHGFLYNRTSWTTIDNPGATKTTWIYGISGNNIVGYYDSPQGHTHNFLYNLTDDSWTTLNKPGASSTWIQGISGSNIFGNYYSDSATYGFLYNLTTQIWTTIQYMPTMRTATINGISGSNIVGVYSDTGGIDHGFLYDGTTWTTLDYPGASTTWINGIDGNNIVGAYWYASGNAYSFIYTIPEPATLLLLGLGGLVLRRKH